LEDAQSTNGTFIDDDKIEGRVEILPGQLFRVGRTWLRVEPMARFSPLEPDDLPF
jgi:pSer/pThr/pTyr-binding forkhead associated (FHA) protein